jgi:S1-C subfamily serine protease
MTAAKTRLVAGANTVLTGKIWRVSAQFEHAITHDLCFALLTTNNARQIVGKSYYAHQTEINAGLLSSQHPNEKTYELTVDVTQMTDPAITRCCLVLYHYGARGGVAVGKSLKLTLDTLEYTVSLTGMNEAALVVAEFYQRNQQWKFRALAETSAYGLSALGRRMGAELDERSPYVGGHENSRIGQENGQAQNLPQRGQQWTGTAFLVAQNTLITNAHVVDGAQQMRLASLNGQYDATVIVSDRTNDLALIRADMSQSAAQTPYVPFRRQAASLAEPITTLGYPLASVMGNGIQVTQGNISGLFGPQNDSRLLQFTAPIQPGSSGSPLLDQNGALLGVISSVLHNTQNMNFAIRSALVMALLDAAGINYQVVDESQGKDQTIINASSLVSRIQAAIWRVECLS